VVAVGQVQRSVEYSTLSGRYASFLEKDILPIVEADYKISHDPAMRVATGGSEGSQSTDGVLLLS
jgi:enterochelin esterase family protein